MNTNIHKPNIILIVLDSLRADRLSCYGYIKNTSPHIDRMAAQSTLFENAIVSAPWTLPSHASLFTGLYPIEHGATDEHLYLSPQHPTLAETLQKMGYHTIAYSRDNAWLSRSTNLVKGFRELFDSTHPAKNDPPSLLLTGKRKIKSALKLKGRTSEQNTIKTVENFIKSRTPSDQPFFIYMNLMATHMPYCPDAKFHQKFHLDKAAPTDIEHLQKDFKEYRTRPESVSPDRLKLLNALYDACIATVDHDLARLFNCITRKPYCNQTLVIITSDHGECLGEHGLLNHWLAVYDTLIKVPLIIYYPPGFTPAKRIEPQVQQHNLFYTILDLVGYAQRQIPPDKIKSLSLVRACEGKVPFPEYTFAEHAYPKMNLNHIRKFNPAFRNEKLVCAKQAIRSNEFKYIRFESGFEELFDLKNDPAETNNILEQNRPMADHLKSQLDSMRAHVKKADVSGGTGAEFDQVIKKRLQDLGYL